MIMIFCVGTKIRILWQVGEGGERNLAKEISSGGTLSLAFLNAAKVEFISEYLQDIS